MVTDQRIRSQIKEHGVTCRLFQNRSEGFQFQAQYEQLLAVLAVQDMKPFAVVQFGISAKVYPHPMRQEMVPEFVAYTRFPHLDCM
jgi:hypothetical protein